jgi:hypothetical protein
MAAKDELDLVVFLPDLVDLLSSRLALDVMPGGE